MWAGGFRRVASEWESEWENFDIDEHGRMRGVYTQDEISKMKRTLDDLKNEKIFKFYLWMNNRELYDEASPELEEIRELILKEKRNYNNRISMLVDVSDTKTIKEAIYPDMESSKFIRNNPLSQKWIPEFETDDWKDVPSKIITSLIVIFSLSKINGYNTNTENDTQFCLLFLHGYKVEFLFILFSYSFYSCSLPR